ncbi:3-hydroxybenzoate 6-hydroxylase [Sphaerisporangium krabiense]|uniref:Salicylate hydroxylase n=1 Tax=Sphaerisporangium krabiense TaxID=763782 RepID=A0A7W9DP37_9ACTN|nr:FAD-dependent monooxygenase [Sphaerisporangium krabiense]MBB5626017.1 salicylate hydroxylase [Sphaerisporangium krabiense]GII64821.1 3-hydroxybenzoate 6-hydroxylase [Sphaerisporangium krabiense]
MGTSNADVIVIGGGIGGLSAALALTRAGLRVRVHEQASAFGEVGAGLQLAPNCTRILDHYGLLGEATALGVLPESMVMKDAVDATELTRLDLRDVERRYGHPYLVIHRSDLHGILLRACDRAGVELLTDARCTSYENVGGGARVRFAGGGTDEAEAVIAADGLHSVARELLVRDEPVSSAYVAYRGAVPFEQVAGNGVHEKDVVVYVGPRCHFVQYPLRAGEMFNQVAVFESRKALAGEEDWGTPDELDAAFAGTCDQVQKGLPSMWRDRWWRMYDRDPIMTWVSGRIALLGDAAHPPLQYMAQGAIMAIEDGWVLGEQVAAQGARRTGQGSGVDWDRVLAAYGAVRPEHCRRVVTTARAWGDLWHLDGVRRLRRNALLRGRDVHDYAFVDWIFGPTALTPEDEPEMFRPIPLDTVPL